MQRSTWNWPNSIQNQILSKSSNLSRSKKMGRATDDGVFGYHGELNNPGQCQPTRQVLTLIPTSLSPQKATSTRDRGWCLEKISANEYIKLVNQWWMGGYQMCRKLQFLYKAKDTPSLTRFVYRIWHVLLPLVILLNVKAVLSVVT